MSEFYLLSLGFVLAFCLPLWYDAKRRKEYGPRPRLLLLSFGVLFLSGIVASVAVFLAGDDSPFAYPLIFSIQTLYVLAFFLLEYSVHAQRIKKNLLTPMFRRNARWLVILLMATAALCAVGWVAYLLNGGASPETARGFVLIKFGLAVFIGAAYFVSNLSFDLESGTIRRTQYTFASGIVLTIIAFIFSFGSSSRPTVVLFLFSLLNCVFAIRVFHEYFVYRMGHVNDMHDQQIEIEQSRTELLNRALLSSPEGDISLIRDTLRAGYEELQSCFSKTDLRFKAMMVFRRSGDLLAVDREEFILEACVPLSDIELLKQMKAEVLRSQIMHQVFDLASIMSAADGTLGFAEAAIRRMVESRRPVDAESLPHSLAKLFKLIVLHPIFNQDRLCGMLVLFKSGFDHVYPQEDLILQSLSRNLSLILTIIESKKALDEKNRLSSEMDIAKNIQTSILPREMEAEGYETEAQMITASEVGGDLYDFVKTKYGNYFDIADVAGHGLPAGITAVIHMAALHAALRTSETIGAELEVSALYDIVNKVLVEINRNRIGSDKFMTCNVLEQKGENIDFAGSHLASLIFRAESGEVEEIEDMQGRAAFQGISETAESSGSRGSFVMKPGDLLLLYTDGLIEARDMNDNFFGIGKLKEIVEENARGPLAEVKVAILERLKGFTDSGDRKKHGGNYADDVSLVLIRRK